MTVKPTTYPIPGYPTVYLTEDNEEITIRPLIPEDKADLLDFFLRIPEEDRFYLKENVTDPRVIERWAEEVDYARAVPLLAIMDGKIVGDGTLHHRRAGARRHIGEVRVVVDPAYRNRGVGRALLHKLMDLAKDRGVERLLFELVVDAEEAARHTAILLGFVPVAALPGHIKDVDGNLHDLMVMEFRAPKDIPEEGGVF